MRIVLRSGKSDKWRVLESASYKQERELQSMLCDSPDLVPVDELRENASPLVIAVPEFGLPGSGNTDILAFSPEGNIALVECKLEANPEIKRKVIGQIFEYGAYLWNMSYDELNNRIRDRCNQDLAELVRAAVEDETWDEEEFRNRVEECLEQGKFMLIIGVDQINEELSRTVQFINSCGNPAFSLHALEMQRFKKGDIEILVPHLHGSSARKSELGSRSQWTWDRFVAVLEASAPPDVVVAVTGLYDWSRNIAYRVPLGTGKETGSFTFHCLREGHVISIFSVYTNGRLQLNYGNMRNGVSEEYVREFHDALHELEAFNRIPADFTKWPGLSLADVLKQADALDRFKQEVLRFMQNAGVDNGG